MCRMNLLIHSQTSTVAPSKFGNQGCDYLSMLELKLIHVSKTGHWWHSENQVWVPYIDGLAQDCSNCSALAMELLQSCTKSSICLIGLATEGVNINLKRHVNYHDSSSNDFIPFWSNQLLEGHIVFYDKSYINVLYFQELKFPKRTLLQLRFATLGSCTCIIHMQPFTGHFTRLLKPNCRNLWNSLWWSGHVWSCQ